MNQREIKIEPVKATLRQMSRIAEASLRLRRGLGITGGSGSGKTSGVKQAAERHTEQTGETVKIIWRNPAQEDAIDNRGALDMRDPEKIDFTPIGEMVELYDDGSPAAADVILVCLEDFGGAPDAIKKAYMPLLLDNRDGTRYISGRKVRDEVIVFFTSNRKKDKGGVNGMLDNVTGRVPVVIEIEPTLDDWIEDYAIPHGLPMTYVAWLKWNPKFFNEDKPRTDSASAATRGTMTSALRSSQARTGSGTSATSRRSLSPERSATRLCSHSTRSRRSTPSFRTSI